MQDNNVKNKQQTEDKKVEQHKHCGDCGRFLEKRLWVPKDYKWKNTDYAEAAF